MCGSARFRRSGHEVRRFATTTAGLLELDDWLRQAGCTHVVMEATGVYWKPVWHILEGEFELVLANPTHIRSEISSPTSPSRRTGRCPEATDPANKALALINRLSATRATRCPLGECPQLA